MTADRKPKHVVVNFPLSFVIVDRPGSGAPDMATLARIAAAITKGMSGDYAPIYERTASVRVDTAVGPGEILCELVAAMDQPGALGDHDWPPIVRVSPLLDAKDGAELSATIDHEIKEATEDLTIDLARMGHDGRFWANEPCDACEQDMYELDGVKLSNFVTPGWYSGVGPFDFLGKLRAPLSVDAGGYAQYFDAKGWHQITHAELAPRSYRTVVQGRSHRRRQRFAAAAAARTP